MKKSKELFPLVLPTYPKISLGTQERCRDIAIDTIVKKTRNHILLSIVNQDFEQIAYYKKFAKQLSNEFTRKIRAITIITSTWGRDEIEKLQQANKLGKITWWNPFESPNVLHFPVSDDELKKESGNYLSDTALVISLNESPTRNGIKRLKNWLYSFMNNAAKLPADYVHSIVIEDLNLFINHIGEESLPLFSNENCAVTCCFDSTNLSKISKGYMDFFVKQKFIINDYDHPKVGKAILNDFIKEREIPFYIS